MIIWPSQPCADRNRAFQALNVLVIVCTGNAGRRRLCPAALVQIRYLLLSTLSALCNPAHRSSLRSAHQRQQPMLSRRARCAGEASVELEGRRGQCLSCCDTVTAGLPVDYREYPQPAGTENRDVPIWRQ